ncbi:hypothetical protein IU450_13880 [Nocardia abscessus]|uniref:hypothetical protein n=1 Tax=Nocardia abscessus TaxID=120957 RepID=UPI00189503A6|nr:hypothetical protein [Nocardia abscessus]MBF6336969.1 hypothetical protein [Nocardia abscessus]
MTRAPVPRLAGTAVSFRRAAPSGRCGRTDDDTARRAVARIAGMRDFASGPALVLAPTQNAVWPASEVGTGSDRGDAVALGRASRGQPQCAETIPAAVNRGLRRSAHTGRG